MLHVFKLFESHERHMYKHKSYVPFPTTADIQIPTISSHTNTAVLLHVSKTHEDPDYGTSSNVSGTDSCRKKPIEASTSFSARVGAHTTRGGMARKYTVSGQTQESCDNGVPGR
jgi:hypothetical protein